MINFRLAADMFVPFVLNRKREPNAPPVQITALPSQRDWRAFEEPTCALRKPRVNVARLKIERAKRVPDMPVPAFLRRQAD